MQNVRTRTLVAVAVAAALSVPLAGLVIVSGLEYARETDEADAAAGVDLAATLAVPSEVSASLQGERAWQTMRVAGFDDVISDVPGPESVARTDAAIAALGDAGETGPIAQTADPLAELASLRADADAAAAQPGGPSLSDDDQALAARYTDVMTAFDDAVAQAFDQIDDPDIRHGAATAWATGRLRRAVDAAYIRVLLGVAAGGDTPGEITELAGALGRVEQGAAELAAAPPPYDQVVGAADPEAIGAPVVAAAEAAVAGAPVSVADLLADWRPGAGDAFDDLEAAIVDRHADIARDAADDARSRARRALGLAGGATAALAVLVVAIAGMVLADRRRPPSDPPVGAAPAPPPPEPVAVGDARP